MKNQPDPERSIDTRLINNPKGETAEGYPRDNVQFWRMWMNRHPETLSLDNKKLIYGVNPKTGEMQKPCSPKIDDKWLEYYPQHKEYKWDKIIHHHSTWINPQTGTSEPGPHAFPVPLSTHKGQERQWHGQ